MQKYLNQDLNQLRITLKNCNQQLADSFNQACRLLCQALKNGNKILICGNGGSAADAEHFAGEIVGRFGFDRDSLPCVSLCTPTATFTAIANDYGYENVFARQVQGLGKPGDVLIGISTSGNSKNILNAVKAADAHGLETIAMTGIKDSALSDTASICLRSPSDKTPRIQEIHGLVIHSMCRTIEEEIFLDKPSISLPAHKIIKADQLKNFAEAIKSFRSVFTNGCFDILHPGHVYVLKKAAELGEILIIGLNSDDSIKRLKGNSRPYHCFADRAGVLAALEVVDYVIEFDEDTPAELIAALHPKVLVKGGDYRIDTIVGADQVLADGGEVKVIPLLEGHSTTGILNNNEN